jgi:hypothetical protein
MIINSLGIIQVMLLPPELSLTVLWNGVDVESDGDVTGTPLSDRNATAPGCWLPAC